MALVVYILKLRHLIPSHPSAPQASSPSSFFLQRFKENGKFDFEVGIFLLPIIVWAKLLLISWLFSGERRCRGGESRLDGQASSKGNPWRVQIIIVGIGYVFFFFVACISIRMKLKFVHVCILLVKVGLNLDSRSSVGSLVLHWKGLCLYIRLISISL